MHSAPLILRRLCPSIMGCSFLVAGSLRARRDSHLSRNDLGALSGRRATRHPRCWTWPIGRPYYSGQGEDMTALEKGPAMVAPARRVFSPGVWRWIASFAIAIALRE